MANNKIRLRIVTPTRELYNDDADIVIMRGIEGDFGVLKGHQPFTTTLDYGILIIKNDGKELNSTLFGGFVDVQPDIITILTDSAEWVEDIDIARAEASKERSERRIKESHSDIDIKRAELSLKRSLLRLDTRHKDK